MWKISPILVLLAALCNAANFFVVSAILFGFLGPAYAGDLWWAVATGYKVRAIGPAVQVEVYGASWNYPDFDSAKAAAIEECQKRWAPCAVDSAWNNSCFAIGRYKKGIRFYVEENRRIYFHPYSTIYGNTRAELVDMMKRQESDHLFGPFKVALMKCSGSK